ncbi:uncharacterized protein LOC129601296 [Paramacrobiotus metropolitanus]|uniref:uncharacterized protein LOC129601296 n=1 Tax=Paramacrobiotus metropolitanus TaxID=2943436 RepID=UPI002445947C|nr:uncharacterized protein LOC129601296 [Paramacrobiotus metropolitanus]
MLQGLALRYASRLQACVARVHPVRTSARPFALFSSRFAESHGHGTGQGSQHEHQTGGHDDHHHDHHHDDPYASWYEDPPSNLVFRSSRLKIPFYIGKPPEMSYRVPCNTDHWQMHWQGWMIGVLMWWSILYGFFSEPEHLFGHYHQPDRRQWTDEELGIPPLDQFPLDPPPFRAEPFVPSR